MRLPATVDGQRVTEASPAAMRSERFTAESVRDPQQLADQLTRLHRALVESHRAATANPHASALVFTGLSFGSGGTKLTIPHGLGRVPRWTLVGWRGASAGASLVEDSRDAKVLVLASYVSGVGDVMVF